MDCSEFNRMLDGYIDGELDDAAKSRLKLHAAQCADCRAKLVSAEQLRDILSHMNDEVSVPLPAQAAWRRAVKEEAHRKRMKLIFRACGAAAAAFVLMLGAAAMLRPESAELINQNMPRVETDGVSEALGIAADAAPMAANSRSVDYVPVIIASENPAQAYEYLCDVIAEYGGDVERESGEDEKKVFVQVPGESAAEFISAVCGIGESQDQAAVAVDASAVSVGVCVTIVGA